MAEYSAGSVGGAWIVSHSGGAPTPSPSPIPNTASVRNITYSKPFQCGICYDFLSHSVDELDEHIMKHKRDLADRLHNRAQTEAERREVAHMDQNHQPLLYYAEGAHAGAQVQGFEYQNQACSSQVQHAFQEYRPHVSECKSASKYYSTHPALLAHHRQVDQTQPTMMTEMFSSECAGRSDGGLAQGSMQHDVYAESLSKRGRFESQAYERDEQHRQAARPDLNEENTADADPATDQIKCESDHVAAAFADAQDGDAVSYHELQPFKMTTTAAAHSGNDGTVTGGYEPDQSETTNHPEPNGEHVPEMHDNGSKQPDVQNPGDSEGNNFATEPTSPRENASSGLDTGADATGRSDNESLKSQDDNSLKSESPDVGRNEKAPRTRRSARVHTGRR